MRYLKALLSLIATLGLVTSCSKSGEKEIYIPQELQTNNFNDPESDWSFSRMLSTPNLAIFWEKGFGEDLNNPPTLEDQAMDINLDNLAQKLEQFYQYYTDTLQFVREGSKAEKYKMMVMLRYSTEGTAYGGDYDQQIGALWVTPNRLRDSTLNCIAHELGHSFQSQINCDGEGVSWGGNGFFEMGAQWMLWQVNPNWVHDEKYHLDAFQKLTHKAFLHDENIYHSPYIIEAWGERHGKPFIAELFRQGKIGEDPVMTYKRITGLDQESFNDQMYENSAKILNFDFPRAWEQTRDFAGTFDTPMETTKDGWMKPVKESTPESYGFNAIALDIPEPGKTVTAQFKGLTEGEDYCIPAPEENGWRYGFVAIDSDGKSIYGDYAKDPEGTISFKAPDGEPLQKLYLLVMGAPKEHHLNPDSSTGTDPQFPYQVKI